MLASVNSECAEWTGEQLAGYFRERLNLATALACRAEQERRFGRYASARECHEQWESAIAEVKRLLPLVRESGVAVFVSQHTESRHRRKRR